MGSYILRRAFQKTIVLMGITFILFFIVNLVPGDPALLYVDRSSNPTPEDIARIRHDLGLDQPLPVRFLDWIGRAIRGDFGRSFQDKRLVVVKIAEALPYTLILAVTSIGLGIILAILAGMWCAMHANTWLDHLISSFSALLVSSPIFWVAVMAQLIVAVKLDLLPTSGWSSYDDGSPLDVARHLVMPVVILALRDIAGLSRYVRSGLLEALNAEYIRTARSKGLGEWAIMFKHALRNALLPVVTLLGQTVPFLVAGAVVIERVFAIPGMGRLALDALTARDYPTLIAVNLLLAVLTVLGNLLADAAYSLIDPRIRHT